MNQALLLCLAMCFTLLLEALGCVWLLLETLVTFGCVPYTLKSAENFAEMLLMCASISSDVMFGCALYFRSDMFG